MTTVKIHIVSDLHFEFHRDGGADLACCIGHAVDVTESDILVVAGDLCNSRLIESSMGELIRRVNVPIIYVPGNHDYYGSSIAAVAERLRQLPVTVLDCGMAEVRGTRFIGGTGWFPKQRDNHLYYGHMSDFSVIAGLRDRYAEKHAEFRAAVEAHCRPGDVVISHHLPSYQSVNARFAGSQLNRFFVGDCEDLIYNHEPALWIHGHTHCPCDYTLHKTRVVCNPLGYPGERTRFQYAKTVVLVSKPFKEEDLVSKPL